MLSVEEERRMGEGGRKLLIVGLDGGSRRIIEPNLDRLPVLRKLIREGHYNVIQIPEEEALSMIMWATIFSGKGVEEHGHTRYVREDGRLVRREDIPVRFLWEIAEERGFRAAALNVPIVAPPINYNADLELIAYGLTWDVDEAMLNAELVTRAAIEALKREPDLLVVVYTFIDRLGHYHWGEPVMEEAYWRFDQYLGILVEMAEDYGFLLVTDHGFRDFDPDKVVDRTIIPGLREGWAKLKGDHEAECLAISARGFPPVTDVRRVTPLALRWLEGGG